MARVKVVLRVRPLIEKELAEKEHQCVRVFKELR